MFYDYRHARRTLDGPIGQRILAQFPKYGLQALAWNENGFRHITNNLRAITYPDDVGKLRIRTMENVVHMASMRALAAVRPRRWRFRSCSRRCRTASLTRRRILLPAILAAKFSQTQKYLSLTQHFYSAGIFVISPKVWSGLSRADQEAFVAAAVVGAKAQRDRINADEFIALSELGKQGMKITRILICRHFAVSCDRSILPYCRVLT